MKKLLIILFSLLLFTSCTKNEEVKEAVPSITSSEIESLVDLDRLFYKYTSWDSASLQFDSNITDETGGYFKITQEDLDTYSEWESFAKSIYSGKLLDSNIKAMEDLIKYIDGQAYVIPGSRGNPVSADYRYETVSTNENETTVNVIFTSLHEESMGEEIIYEYTFEYTDRNWRIKDILHKGVIKNNISFEHTHIAELINISENSEGYNDDGSMWYLWYTLRLPKVAISEETDEIINGKINDIFYQPALAEIEERKASFDINYKSFERDGVMSLLVVKHSGFDVTGYTYYTVVVDTKEKEILDFDKACEKLGYDSQELLSGIEKYDKNGFYINENDEPVIIIFEMNEAYMSEFPLWYNTITKEKASLSVPN